MTIDRENTRLLVAGNGVAACATAALLAHARFVVTLVGEPDATGDAMPVVLHHNALRVLDALSLTDEVAAAGSWLVRRSVRGGGGSELSVSPLSTRALVVPRRALLAALVRSMGTRVERIGAPIASLAEGKDDIVVAVVDGREHRASAVIVADGGDSPWRTQLFGPAVARPSGVRAYRYALGHLPLPDGEIQDVLGPGVRATTCRVGSACSYLCVFEKRPDGEPETATGKPSEKALAALGKDLAAAVSGAGPAHGDACRDLDLPSWRKGRIVLAGDAAHLVTPSLEQGAAMALEDAKTLEYVLCTASDVEEALGRYEALRRPRLSEVREASWQATTVLRWENPAATAFRSLLIRTLPSASIASRIESLADGGAELDHILAYRPRLRHLSAAGRDLLTFLVKVGRSDGRFDEDERSFVMAALAEAGEAATLEEIAAIEAAVKMSSVASVVTPFESSTTEIKERVLLLGAMVAAANGRFLGEERRALHDAARALGIPSARMTELSNEAIKTAEG
jgi:2-polyprenyl-6-methoxyphenol hydroxylase-like FAD-dependent oxidoreductase/tellurite resistance protein